MKGSTENCPTGVARMNGIGNTKREVADNEQQKFPCMSSGLYELGHLHTQLM